MKCEICKKPITESLESTDGTTQGEYWRVNEHEHIRSSGIIKVKSHWTEEDERERARIKQYET